MTAFRQAIVGLGLAAAAFFVGTRFGTEPSRPAPIESPRVVAMASLGHETPGTATLDPHLYAQLVRDVVRAELAMRSTLPEDPDAEPTEPESSPESSTEPTHRAEVRAGAEAVIEEAIAAGRWSPEDSEAVRVAATQLTGPDIIEVHRVLMEAVVAGELVIDYDGPLF